MFSDFVSLIFPESCQGCNETLQKGEKLICANCRYELPKTNNHLLDNNDLEKKFWGKVSVKRVLSFLKFHKGGKVQNLIHQLKYGGQEELGRLLGEWYGLELYASSKLSESKLVVPVPLHKSRLKKRGYNQSDSFAEGLSRSLQIEWKPDVLERLDKSTTQTDKSRFSRWENVNRVFQLRKGVDVLEKNILLVDDVITTGATLEECARALLNGGAREVSIATIASAEYK